MRYFAQRQAQVQQQNHDQSEEIRERLAFLELQAQVGGIILYIHGPYMTPFYKKVL